MTIKKKNKVLWTVICLVGILAVGTVAVLAFSGSATTVIENAGGVTINNPVQEVQAVDENLGAVASSQALDAMVCTSDLCTFTATGDFIDASTTIVSFADPFVRATTTAGDVVLNGTTNDFGYGLTGATSTVDFALLDINTAATSSYEVNCGAATNPSVTPSVLLINTASQAIATSSTGVLHNNLTAALGGIADASTVESITLNGDYPYFVCLVVTTGYNSTFTSDANTFAGKYAVKVHKTR